MISTFTTNLDDLEVEAECEYDKGEPEIRYYRGGNGDGHPGCPANSTLLHLFLYNHANGKRIDLVDFITDQQTEDIEQEHLERLETEEYA